MQTLNERIQIEVLGRLGNKPWAYVDRAAMAEVFGVTAKRIDDVMSRCSLVVRVRYHSERGARIGYRLPC